MNMPRMNGLELLGLMKEDPCLARVPVVMFTTSNLEDDVNRAYDAGACSFITKPVDFLQLRTLADRLTKYWTTVAIVPGRPNNRDKNIS